MRKLIELAHVTLGGGVGSPYEWVAPYLDDEHMEYSSSLIRERTGAGRVIAKANGVRFGRPRKLKIEQRALALRLLREGRSPEVAKTFRVHGVTIYRLAAAEATITP